SVPKRRTLTEPTPNDQHGRTDRYGDPLPERALARLGTTRLRHWSRSRPGFEFSPAGNFLATGGNGKTSFWHTNTGKLLMRVTDGPCIAFSVDDRRLALGSAGSITLWDTATGKRLLDIKD